MPVHHSKLVKYNVATGRWFIIDRDFKFVYWARVVMEDKLGRPLLDDEVVHHIDRDRGNDDPDNLVVFQSQADHMRWHIVRGHLPTFTMAA